MAIKNLFEDLPVGASEEVVSRLLGRRGFSLKRIVSTGQATPDGKWYDQNDHEWVVLLKGSAGLRFEGEQQIQVLKPGDYLEIPAHKRHRVEWTDLSEETVWLALHYRESDQKSE